MVITTLLTFLDIKCVIDAGLGMQFTHGKSKLSFVAFLPKVSVKTAPQGRYKKPSTAHLALLCYLS